MGAQRLLASARMCQVWGQPVASSASCVRCAAACAHVQSSTQGARIGVVYMESCWGAAHCCAGGRFSDALDGGDQLCRFPEGLAATKAVCTLYSLAAAFLSLSSPGACARARCGEVGARERGKERITTLATW